MAERKILSRNDILGAGDLTRQEIFIKEWGGSVFIQSLTIAERDEYEKIAFPNDKVNREVFMTKLVAMSAVDAEGKKIFTDGDIEALRKKNAKVIMRLYKVAQRLSGMTEGDLEEFVKNSEPGQPG